MPITYRIAGAVSPAIFLFQFGVFCLFLAVAQRLSNQWPQNNSVILHHKR